MRTDGRTDMTKLIVAFRNFANAPKKLDTKFNKTQKNKNETAKSTKEEADEVGTDSSATHLLVDVTLSAKHRVCQIGDVDSLWFLMKVKGKALP